MKVESANLGPVAPLPVSEQDFVKFTLAVCQQELIKFQIEDPRWRGSSAAHFKRNGVDLASPTGC